MKAGQLIKVLQIVDPNDEVYFSVGYDNDDRKDMLAILEGDPDVFTDMKAEVAELSCISQGQLRLDISLFPSGLVPSEIRSFCESYEKARTETNQGDNS